MKRGLLRCVYTLSGENAAVFTEYLRLRGVNVLRMRSAGEKTFEVTVDFNDKRKIIAICGNLCYTIKKCAYRGVLSPLFTAFKHIGFVAGLAVFLLMAAYSDGFVFKVDVTGSGACYSSRTKTLVSETGIKPFSRFEKVNFSELESKILKDNPELSFAAVKKKGNRLVINLEISRGNGKTLSENEENIVSDVDGTVGEVKVLRGTAVVNKGDVVKKGAVLVKACITDKDGAEYPTYVIATVEIIYEKNRFFPCALPDETAKKTAAFTAASESDDEPVEIVTEETDGGVNVYMKLKRVISA